MEPTTILQSIINQIGMSHVLPIIPQGSKILKCPTHGYYVANKYGDNACPLCTNTVNVNSGTGNGVTATDAELYIDLNNPIEHCL